MKYQAVARANISGGANDEDLRALNGIVFGQIYDIDEMTAEIERQLINDLLDNNPDFAYQDCKVEPVL